MASWLGAATAVMAASGTAIYGVRDVMVWCWAVSYSVTAFFVRPAASTVTSVAASIVYAIVFFCSPAIYLVQFFLAPLWLMLGLLPALQPLYVWCFIYGTFCRLGCAILAGCFGGSILYFAKFFITWGLYGRSMDESAKRGRDNESISDSQSQTLSEDNRFHNMYDFEEYDFEDDGSFARSSSGREGRRPWRAGRSSQGNSKEVQDMLRTYVSVKNSKTRRAIPGLLRMTIHEEDDDESE